MGFLIGVMTIGMTGGNLISGLGVFTLNSSGVGYVHAFAIAWREKLEVLLVGGCCLLN